MKNKIIFGAFFIAVAFFAASCAHSFNITSDYRKNTDFSKYQSFSVYGLTTTLNVNQFNAERVVNAIRTEMKKKGFREDNSNPDLLVNAATIVKNKESITASGNGGWYRPYRNMDIQTVQYKEGTLVIHMVDAKEQELVWEGTLFSEMTKRPKNPEKAISTAVSKLLEGFPSVAKASASL